MEDEGKISDVEEGDEATGIESPDASSRRKSKRLKEIQKRASEAKERQQRSLGNRNAPVGNATPTSLGLAAAKVGRAGAKVMSETRATSMYGEPTPYQPPELEAPMDVSPYQGETAPVDTIFEKSTFPRVVPRPPEEEPINQGHVRHSAASVTPSTNATAASTISSMTSSTLRQTKYEGVSHGEIEPNEMPTGNEGRDIFENLSSEGNGPGKWLLNYSFEKVPGERVADQLHSSLATTVKLSAASVKGFKLHPHDTNPDLPDVTSEKPEGNFPPTGGACQQYVHFPMEWQLAAAKEKKVRPPKAASEHRYDDEAGEYIGPARVTGVIVVSADGDVKKMVQRMRLDLEGTGIGIWWKDVQMKDTVNAIQIPGVIHGFCLEGITQSLYWGLKECEKKLCLKNKQKLEFIDTPLPKMKVSFKDAKKMKGGSELAKKYSLNKLPEFRQNGCKMLSIEASPMDYERMGIVWSYFYDSGMCGRTLGSKTKILLIPTGMVEPGNVTTVQRYKTLHVKLTSKLEFTNMPDVVNLFKKVEIRMADGAKPHRKFTSLQQEFYDLMTPSNTPVIDAIIPRLRGMSAGSADVTMRIKDAEAVEIARNIAFCPAAWWWGLWHLKGYTLGTIQALMESFDTDAALLAGHSTFNAEDWTVKTAFGRDDDFLDREEALLSSEEEDECANSDVEMEFEGDAREELVSTLRDRDDDLKSINSRGSAASRRTNFSSSTGNSSVRSANTAKLARDLKDNTLGLAKANLQNANLERIAKEASTAKAKLEQETVALRKKQEESERMAEDLTRRLQAMEAIMARGMGNPLGERSSESPATYSDTAGQQAAAESKTENLSTYIQEENEGLRGA